MQMVALGDMRFLARELHDDDLDSDSLASISVSELSEFVDSFIKLTEDAVIRRYKLSFAEAETAGPAAPGLSRPARGSSTSSRST